MTSIINYGILGAGHLGSYHAQQLSNIPGVNLVGVFDINQCKARSLSKKHNIKSFKSIETLINCCDALSIATPASNHFESAYLALQKNCHVFIEKPLTKNTEEGKKLLELIVASKLKVQVGHIERFNAALLAFIKNNPRPQFIESHRLCSFNERGLDVDVVLDLMIHDIDLCLLLINDKIKKINAYGSSIITNSIDMANVRLEFSKGITANLTASRVSLKNMRQMRIFQKKSYSVLDFQKPSLNTWKINRGGVLRGKKENIIETNALFQELQAFVLSIQKDLPVAVGAEEALKALNIASQIQAKIGKK